MWRAASLPWPIATVTVRSAGTMSPPAKIPGWPVIMFGPTSTTPSSTSTPSTPSSSERSRVLAERQHHRVGLELLELAGRLREAGLVELHPLDTTLPSSARLIVDSQRISTPSSIGLLDLEVVRGHPLAGAPVDDDRLAGAEPLRGARRVHRRVAAAVDDDPPAELRALLALHAAQQRDRVEDARGLAGGDVGALGEVGADGEEGGVEAALAHALERVLAAALELELDAHREDPLDLGVEHLARQPVGGDAEAHHAARPSAPASWIVTAWPSRRRW